MRRCYPQYTGPMAFMRSERLAAALLVTAAVVGLVLANTGAATFMSMVASFHFGIPALGINLSVEHWTKDGLLAIFFFIAAIELKHELKHGELDTIAKAIIPTVAAIGGVIVPAVIYLAIAVPSGLVQGWPIPTATDIAFALGVLAIVGRSLPPKFRALLLALAVIDDLIAIVIIAIFFTATLSWLPLLLAIPTIALFGWLSTKVAPGRWWVVVALILLGIAAWALVLTSGIHPTVAGVALGLVMAGAPADEARHAIEPWSNVVVLPLFALFAALVPIPQTSVAQLSPAFWAVLVALPIGKIVGITAGALLAVSLTRDKENRLPIGDVIAIAGLGGIGFTVSLLMNELAFETHTEISNEVTLAVLLASLVAAIVGGALTAARSRHYAKSA
jgi:NhaA family Na+:H+ antiporter